MKFMQRFTQIGPPVKEDMGDKQKTIDTFMIKF